jgi:peptide/nickel transport system substrate-binding protein
VFVWAFEREFTSYNLLTPEGGMLGNMVVLNAVQPGFTVNRPDGSVAPRTEFGTFEKISDRPLTVRYRINNEAVWSDGTPIGCEDMVFAWLSQSGVTGPKGFAVGGTTGYEDMEKPKCVPGGKTVTITYRRPFAGWLTQFGTAEILPSHIVARRGGLTRSWVEYADDPRSADLAKAIEFFNHGWALRPGELKKELMPSAGPYVIDSWAAGQSLTLKANPRWWGPAPRSDTVVIRYLSGAAQAQALENGEIHAMNPDPQADLMRQLTALKDRVNITTGSSFQYEHLDFSFRGVFKDRSLREAFAKCVPRQEIVDKLVKPMNPAATIQQSRFVLPFQPNYAHFENLTGDEDYDTVDLAGARRLLAGRRPKVRLGWHRNPSAPNKRRADTVLLIQSSCEKAGFDIVDAGTPTFMDQEWVSGNYDIALFSWTLSVDTVGQNARFETGGGLNTMGYGNSEVDSLLRRQTTELDPARQVAIAQRIDLLMWNDLSTIPLFALPAVVATAKGVTGVRYNPTSVNLTWNIEEWARR